MNTQNETVRSVQEAFRVGGRVAFMMGRRRLIGQIVEDRGGIGSEGRHLFRVEVPLEFEPALVTELPAEELQEV